MLRFSLTGVIQCLSDLELLKESTPISGTSAGALAAAFVISGISLDEGSEIVRQIQSQLLETGYGWKVIDVLKATLLVRSVNPELTLRLKFV